MPCADHRSSIQCMCSYGLRFALHDESTAQLQWLDSSLKNQCHQLHCRKERLLSPTSTILKVLATIGKAASWPRCLTIMGTIPVYRIMPACKGNPHVLFREILTLTKHPLSYQLLWNCPHLALHIWCHDQDLNCRWRHWLAQYYRVGVYMGALPSSYTPVHFWTTRILVGFRVPLKQTCPFHGSMVAFSTTWTNAISSHHRRLSRTLQIFLQPLAHVSIDSRALATTTAGVQAGCKT